MIGNDDDFLENDEEHRNPRAVKCRNPIFQTPGPPSKLKRRSTMINVNGMATATPIRGPARFITVVNAAQSFDDDEEFDDESTIDEYIEDAIMKSPMVPTTSNKNVAQNVNRVQNSSPSKRIALSPIKNVMPNSPRRSSSFGLQKVNSPKVSRMSKSFVNQFQNHSTPNVVMSPAAASDYFAPDEPEDCRPNLLDGLSQGKENEFENQIATPPLANRTRSKSNTSSVAENVSLNMTSSQQSQLTETPKRSQTLVASPEKAVNSPTHGKLSRARKKLPVAASTSPMSKSPESEIFKTPVQSVQLNLDTPNSDSPFFKVPLPPKNNRNPFRKFTLSTRSQDTQKTQNPARTKKFVEPIFDQPFDTTAESDSNTSNDPSPVEERKSKRISKAAKPSQELEQNEVVEEATEVPEVTDEPFEADLEMEEPADHEDVPIVNDDEDEADAEKEQSPSSQSRKRSAKEDLSPKAKKSKENEPEEDYFPSANDDIYKLYENARYVNNWIPRLKGKKLIIEGDLLDFE